MILSLEKSSCKSSKCTAWKMVRIDNYKKNSSVSTVVKSLNKVVFLALSLHEYHHNYVFGNISWYLGVNELAVIYYCFNLFIS